MNLLDLFSGSGSVCKIARDLSFNDDNPILAIII